MATSFAPPSIAAAAAAAPAAPRLRQSHEAGAQSAAAAVSNSQQHRRRASLRCVSSSDSNNPVSASSTSTSPSSSSYCFSSPSSSSSSSSPSSSSSFKGMRGRRRSAAAVAAQPATEVEGPALSDNKEVSGKVLLEVKELSAVVADSRTEILRGVDLVIREGEIHAIMGKNGSGKSTLSKVLVGHPDYEVTSGSVNFKGENLLDKEPEVRSHLGLFMSFQSPVEIPGVSNMDFLRMACNARRSALALPEFGPLEFYGYLTPKLAALNVNPTFLDRNVNEGFSGGEKKRNEILQLAVLEADMAILDEIDSGLDVDALRDVASAVNGLLKPENAVLLITHYQRLLDYIKPTFVHIMEAGRIIKTGDSTLAKQLEAGGYEGIKD